MKIMVTGASGEYGQLALKYLKIFSPNDDLFGLVRHEGDAVDLKKMNVQPQISDYANLESLKSAFKGIDKLLFVSVPVPGIQKNVVEAAVYNKISFIAYTGIYGGQYQQLGLEKNHLQTEAWIKDSGIAHTFLRNSWYLEINTEFFNKAQEKFEYPYLDSTGKISFVYKKDLAEAGARIISDPPMNSIVDLSGIPLTYQEIGEQLQKALDKPLKFEPQTNVSSLQNALISLGSNPQNTAMIAAYQEYAAKGENGQSVASPKQIESILGHPLTSMPSAINQILKANMNLTK